MHDTQMHDTQTRNTLREIAQARCDDVVLAAAAFGPNAMGRRELSSLRGMTQRQVLKSRGSFLADRVVLAVTPLEVVAIALGPLSSRFRETLRFEREDLVIRGLVSNIGDHRPAFAIVGRGGAHLELAVLAHDDNTRAVLRLLFEIGARGTVRR